ncbi:MAG: T9SS type A sorting domain-containing protein, partial [Bacteroidota bacterium]
AFAYIAGGTMLINGTSPMDSWVSPAINIPAFTFNCVTYTTAYVTSNGQLTLGGAAPSSFTYTGISSTIGSGIAICPFSADLDRRQANANSEIRWQTVGNEVVFQWKQVCRFGLAEEFSFQIRLNTVTGAVVFIYGNVSGIPNVSTLYQPQVGIRTSATDYNNRKVDIGAENWAAPLAGTANTDVCRYTNTAPAKFFSTNRQYIWTPPPVCSGIPAAGTANGPGATCSGSATTITLTGYTSSCGISYQWQSAPAVGGPWTNIGGATSTTLVDFPTIATYYRCITTCSNGGGTNTSSVTSVSITSCCTHTIRLTDTYGDGWNGGTVTVKVNGVDVHTNISLAGGFGPQDFTFSAATGDVINVTETNPGSFPTEMRYQVFDNCSNTIMALAQPVATPGHNGAGNCGTPTVPGCATNPSPANGATGVNPCNVIETWTAPVNTGCNAATSYDIYLGTTPVPPFFKNVTGTSLDSPGALIDNTIYYWKVVPKNPAGSAVGCPTWSFTTGTAGNPNYCFTGNSFNSPGYGANCATITPELNGQLGCIWNRGYISFASAFDYSVSCYFGNNVNGADGCAFVFQNSPAGVTACGNPGNQLGAGGIPNAVVIEFDTYDNDNPMHVYDMSNDHTAIEIDGNLAGPGAPFVGPVDARPGGLNLDDGNMHILRVTWNPGTQTLNVYIDASLRLTSTYDFVTNVFGGNTNVHWGFTGSTGGLNNLQYFCPTTIPLPVELIDFNAKCNDNKVFVNWSTASETNCDYFTIERTFDGIKFETVGKVPGAGNSNHIEYYSWTDLQPVGDNSYYRLRQTDFDGKTKIYSLVSVVCNNGESLLNFTNTYVNDDRLNVGFITSKNGNHSISLYDMLGNLVSFSSMDVEAGQHEINLNTQSLNRGLYLLNINNGQQSISRKIQFIK